MASVGILPHERILLEARLRQLEGEQQDAADLLREAMDQSSETWHDNAPADAASLESKRVASAAKLILESLKKPDIPYPEHDSTKVAIGSLVMVSLLGADVAVVVAGDPVVYDEASLAEGLGCSGELVVVSVDAPLGAGLIDGEPGLDGSYKIAGDNEAHFSIHAVDNRSVQAFFAANTET
ncbi:hypothetical protein E6P97_01255 [Patescibacteria group bacterium]|nr:MAG: hypothetical protein E6P97_01255 [Patescibacteria group bacterium]